jgi:hypothetical protein
LVLTRFSAPYNQYAQAFGFRIDQSRWPLVLAGILPVIESRNLILYRAMRHQTVSLAARHVESSGIPPILAAKALK